MFPAVINRIRTTPSWLKAVGKFRERKCVDAIDIIKRIEEVTPLLPHQLAFLAQVYIYMGRSDIARPYLIAAKEQSRGSREYDKYVTLYVRVILSLMDGGEPVAPLIEASRAVRCSKVMKRWLPLRTDP